MTPLELATLFHNTYEKLAPSFDYETRKGTKDFDSESSNGKLMIAVSEKIMKKLGIEFDEPVLEEKKCKCVTCKCDKFTENKQSVNTLKIISLFDTPKVEYNLTESDNEIYVDSVDIIKDACGTGRISFLGRTILTNVCESNNIVHAKFDVEIDGKEYNSLEFVVKITENNKSYIKLNKQLLK